MTQGQFLQHESTALVAAAQIYAGPFLLTKLSGFSIGAAAVFVQLYDSFEQPADGSVPRLTIRAQPTPNGQFSWTPEEGAAGIRFVNGLWICASTGPGTLTLGAAELWIDAEGLRLGPVGVIPPPPTPPEMHRYFGPSNADGLVTIWVDTGTGPTLRDAVAYAEQPTAELPPPVQLTEQNTVTSLGTEGCFAAFPQLALPFSFAAVAAAADESGNAIVTFWNADTEADAIQLYYTLEDGWSLYFNNDQHVIVGPEVRVLAAAISIDPDGSYEITYSADWGPNMEISDSAAVPFGELNQMYIQADADEGDEPTYAAEILSWTQVFRSSGQRSTTIAALRDEWMPVYPALRWFAPDLAPGAVSSWVDQSVQHVDATNSYAPTQPHAAIGLNGLITLQASASQPLYTDDGAFPTGSRFVSLAFVLVAPDGAEQLFVNLSDFNEENFLTLQYFTSVDLGLLFGFGSPGGGASVAISSGPGIFSGVITLDPTTGEYLISSQESFGPTVVLTGTEPSAAGPGGYSFFGFNSAEPYPSLVVTELGELRFYVSDVAQTEAQQQDVLDELAAIWKPSEFIFSGESLTPGLVSSWPNSAAYPLADAEQSDNTRQPTAVVGLNGLPTAQFAGSASAKNMSVDPFGPYTSATLAMVGKWNDGGYLAVDIYSDGDDVISIEVNPGGVGDAIVFSLAFVPVETSAALSDGDVIAVTFALDGLTGEWTLAYRINWAPSVTSSGTAAPIVDPFLYPDCVISRFGAVPSSELAQWNVYGRSLDPAQQETLLDALQATWQGDPVIVPVGSNPEVLAAFTPAALNTDKWQTTLTFANAWPQFGFVAILVSDDPSGGSALWMSDDQFNIYPIAGGSASTSPFTWGAGQVVTVTVDPGVSIEIAGALTGNGVFDISGAAPPYYAPGTDLYVGCYSNTASYVFDGTISDVIHAP